MGRAYPMPCCWAVLTLCRCTIVRWWCPVPQTVARAHGINAFPTMHVYHKQARHTAIRGAQAARLEQVCVCVCARAPSGATGAAVTRRQPTQVIEDLLLQEALALSMQDDGTTPVAASAPASAPQAAASAPASAGGSGSQADAATAGVPTGDTPWEEALRALRKQCAFTVWQALCGGCTWSRLTTSFCV